MNFKLIIFFGIWISFIFYACQGKDAASERKVNVESEVKHVEQSQDDASKIIPMITFIELGSVNCIPCKKMQPVMKAIEEKYGEQIKVIFYDVWKPDQRKYADEYGIRLIPTQVFLDKAGKEIFRHEGFYPEQEIDSFLQGQGLKPKTDS